MQSLSRVQLFVTPWTAAHQASLSITNSWSLLKLMSIEPGMSFNHLILYCPFFLLFSIFRSIKVFSKSWLFASGGQSIRAPASEQLLPMNIQDWLPLGLTGLISLLPKGLSTVFSSTIVQNSDTEALIPNVTYLEPLAITRAGLGKWGGALVRWGNALLRDSRETAVFRCTER